jgi:hypothetical protein
MAEFLVELYVPRSDGSTVEAEATRASVAADEVSREGTPVRYLRSIFVPEDETCLLLYEAESPSAVAEAALRANLQFERVTEAVTASVTQRGEQK